VLAWDLCRSALHRRELTITGEAIVMKPRLIRTLIRSRLREKALSLRQRHENGENGMRRVPGANHKLPL
jgi:hypothetical protein